MAFKPFETSRGERSAEGETSGHLGFIKPGFSVAAR